MLHKFFNIAWRFRLTLIALTIMVFLSGCASFTESVVSFPGTVVDAVGSVGSATWELATGWLPGAGESAPEVVETVSVTEEVAETTTSTE
jgi:uncharacterized protein YceK